MRFNVLATDGVTGQVLRVNRIAADFQTAPAPNETAEPGLFLAPGFVDIQVNGFGGIDFNALTLSEEELAHSIAVIETTGVTRFFPTVITGPRAEMALALKNLERVRQSVDYRSRIAGFHVEGPHISPEDGPRGAHRLDCVRAPDFDEYLGWQEATGGRIRVVTLSPHWPGAPAYIQQLVRAGTTVSIGHTHASAAQLSNAVAAGATLSTHLGNAAAQVMPKFDNYIWHQLADDSLTASFIADGIHLPAPFLKSAIRSKSPARTILVTDASAPAGALPGRYHLGAQHVDLNADGRVVLSGTDRLAGSALKLNDAIAHVMRVAGVDHMDAIRMATVNPARATGLADSQSRVLYRLHPERIEVLAVS